jgi:hypothetical protein
MAVPISATASALSHIERVLGENKLLGFNIARVPSPSIATSSSAAGARKQWLFSRLSPNPM